MNSTDNYPLEDIESATVVSVTELQQQLIDLLKQPLKPITKPRKIFALMYEVLLHALKGDYTGYYRYRRGEIW